MSLLINGVEFDDHTGRIDVAKFRSRLYTPSDRPGIGAQILGRAGKPFDLVTTRFETEGTAVAVAISYQELIGSNVAIVENGVAFSSAPYLVAFHVSDVQNAQIEMNIRAQTVRSGVRVNISPVAIITTTWTLVPIPA